MSMLSKMVKTYLLFNMLIKIISQQKYN